MDQEDLTKEKIRPKQEIQAEPNDNSFSDPYGTGQQSGVKKKLKTLTFCRRRKGAKEVSQKRKSPWTFKFGPKVRDCSSTNVPIAGNSSDTCVCTVYRRTDQLSNTDLDTFLKVDSLPKCVLSSNGSFFSKPQSSSSAIISSCEILSPRNQSASTNKLQSLALNNDSGWSNHEDLSVAQVTELDTESTNTLVDLDSQEEGSLTENYSSSKDKSCSTGFEDAMSAYRNERLPMDASHSSGLSQEEQIIGADGETANPDHCSEEGVKANGEEYPVEDWDERARLQRAREMEEGVDPPPGYKPKPTGQPANPQPIQEHSITELATYLQNHLFLTSTSKLLFSMEDSVEKSVLSQSVLEMLQELTLSGLFTPSVHTQVDYIHCLVPDLLDITSCSCYWGKMDRYEAEKLLENKPEGTFLLRDSAQEDFLFSVSFQRYGKTLHARIEQWNHKFSFDSHDPGVFSSGTVCGLIEHYKDPSCCMYFDPMLTIPLHRTFPFSLQHLSRSVICNNITYDRANSLKLPKSLKFYLKEYHYKQRVKVRRYDY